MRPAIRVKRVQRGDCCGALCLVRNELNRRCGGYVRQIERIANKSNRLCLVREFVLVVGVENVHIGAVADCVSGCPDSEQVHWGVRQTISVECVQRQNCVCTLVLVSYKLDRRCSRYEGEIERRPTRRVCCIRPCNDSCKEVYLLRGPRGGIVARAGDRNFR